MAEGFHPALHMMGKMQRVVRVERPDGRVVRMPLVRVAWDNGDEALLFLESWATADEVDEGVDLWTAEVIESKLAPGSKRYLPPGGGAVIYANAPPDVVMTPNRMKAWRNKG